jgi:hypothetical protein
MKSINFNPWNFEEALFFHLVYHYNIKTHINHLIFLNTYIFGILLLIECFSTIITWCFLLLYVFYIMYLHISFGLLYSFILVFIKLSVEYIYSILQNSSWSDNYIYIIGFSIIIISFIFQLSSHFLFEIFHSSPSLSHGLVTAPFLEICSIKYRISPNQNLEKNMWIRVDSQRNLLSNIL